MKKNATDSSGTSLHDHWNITLEELDELGKSNWTPDTFVAHDGYTWGNDKQGGAIRPTPPNNSVMPYQVILNGWDHEHCTICYASTGGSEKWLSNELDDWICEACYKGMQTWLSERE